MISVVYPPYFLAEWKLTPPFPMSPPTPDAAVQHHKSVIILYVTSLRKGQNAKFEVWFLLNSYHFHTIVKLNIVSLTM